MAITCRRECYWQGRKWNVGDVLDPGATAYPRHFEDTDAPVAEVLLPQFPGGLAVIVGDVPGIEDEIRIVPLEAKVFAVNRAGYRIQRVDFWVTFHTDMFGPWIEVRRRFGWHDPVLVGDGGDGPPHAVSTAGVGDGGSALFALDTARRMGFDRFLLIGVHLLDEGYHRYRPAFLRAWPRSCEAIRATGGWTREQYGAPDAKWLGAEAQMITAREKEFLYSGSAGVEKMRSGRTKAKGRRG